VVVEPQLPLGRGQPIQVYLVKISWKEATISTEIKAFQDPTSTIDPELFKERMLKLNAKEVK
jgi:ABC-type histidine transport system ATPase subunit